MDLRPGFSPLRPLLQSRYKFDITKRRGKLLYTDTTSIELHYGYAESGSDRRYDSVIQDLSFLLSMGWNGGSWSIALGQSAC